MEIICFVGLLFLQRLLLQEVIKPYDMFGSFNFYLMPSHLFHDIPRSTEVQSLLDLSPKKLDIKSVSSGNLIAMPSYNKDEQLTVLLAHRGL